MNMVRLGQGFRC